MIFKKNLQIVKKYSQEKNSSKNNEISKKLLNQTTQWINKDIENFNDNVVDDNNENINDENNANDDHVVVDLINVVTSRFFASSISFIDFTSMIFVVDSSILKNDEDDNNVNDNVNDNDDNNNFSKYSEKLRRVVIKKNSKRKKIFMIYENENKKQKHE